MIFVPTITQIQNFPEVAKGSERDFTYCIEILKVLYMRMICRVSTLHTNRNRFLHLSEERNW